MEVWHGPRDVWDRKIQERETVLFQRILDQGLISILSCNFLGFMTSCTSRCVQVLEYNLWDGIWGHVSGAWMTWMLCFWVSVPWFQPHGTEPHHSRENPTNFWSLFLYFPDNPKYLSLKPSVYSPILHTSHHEANLFSVCCDRLPKD